MDTPKTQWARSLWQESLLASSSKSQFIIFCSISFVVFLTRVPFLLPGYGIDPDAWGVAFIAKQIFTTHQYAVSRFPGYPLQELSYAFLWRGGPLLLNGITALMSGFAAGFLALAGREITSLNLNAESSKINTPILGGLIFAFTPVIFINSVNSMDYLWAMAFVLGSLYLTLVKKTSLAGLLLGLAIGTRITSIIMLVTLVLVLLYKGGPLKDVIKFILISIAIGGVFYIPALTTYGISFLTHHQGEQIPPTTILSKATIEIWGRLGFGIFIIALIMSLWCAITSASLKFRLRETAYWRIWLITIALYLLLFLALPHEAAYLIPVLPFIILLFEVSLNRKMLLILCIALMCSSLLIEIYPKSQILSAGIIKRFNEKAYTLRGPGMNLFIAPTYGAMYYDHALRTEEINHFFAIFDYGNNLREKSVILVGWNLPKFAMLGMNKNQENVLFSDFFNKDTIQSFIDHGINVYYMPEILYASINLYGVDLTQLNTTPLNIY